MTKRQQADKATTTPAAVSFEEWRLENWQRLNGLSQEDMVFLWVKETIPEALPGMRRTMEERKRLPVFPGPQKTLIEALIDFEKMDRGAAYVLIGAFIRSNALPAQFTELQLLKTCVGCGIPLTDRAYDLAREHKLLKATKRAPKKPEGEKTRVGPKGYDLKTRKRDAEIYNALKSGATYEGLMDRFNMKKSELIKARGREYKRRKKQAE